MLLRGILSAQLSRSSRWRSGSPEFVKFLGAEYAGSSEKAEPFGGLQRESTSPALHHINRQMGVFPELELWPAHIDWASLNRSEINVLLSNLELTPLIAHWGATIAATA